MDSKPTSSLLSRYLNRPAHTERLHFYLLLLSATALLVAVYDVGFPHPEWLARPFRLMYDWVLLIHIGVHLLLWRYRVPAIHSLGPIRHYSHIILLVIPAILLARFFQFSYEIDHSLLRILTHPGLTYLLLLGLLFTQLSLAPVRFGRLPVSTPLLFVISFFLLILMGTGLLLLPKSVPGGDLSFTDACFTATSAVCVTGLIVRDTGTEFTGFGQSILLILIQLGGLGIMTFTSFFSYFFRRDASFNDQLILKYLTNSNTLGDVFTALKQIIFITLALELAGAILIYVQLPSAQADRLYFSIFHAVSAFCNAGFSTRLDGLATGALMSSYGIHWVCAFLLILGGLGFPLVLGLISWLRQRLRLRAVDRRQGRLLASDRLRLLDVNTRLVIFTTLILLVGGFVLLLALEWYHAFGEHSLYGKLTAAFFAAASPRTAGFNTVPMASFGLSSVLVIMFLMWIGASPGSTGGGIKTSTFGVAVLAILNTARQRGRIEISGRTIAQESVNRAFTVLFLSILIIATGFFLLTLTDPEQDPRDLVFECISAYSTVGLSLGLTAKLSVAGRWILIVLMFTGRVGILTILFSTYRQARTYAYRLPEESVLIN